MASSPHISETPGNLSSDQLPGAKGSGLHQSGGLGFQSDFESK